MLRRAHLISSDEVAIRYQAFVRSVMSEALTDGADVSYVGTRCPKCKKLHIVPVEAHFYKCKCSEHVERPTFKHRVPLTDKGVKSGN